MCNANANLTEPQGQTVLASKLTISYISDIMLLNKRNVQLHIFYITSNKNHMRLI